MPKYLFEATYSDEGLTGLAADGAAKRQRDVKAAFKSLGGKVETVLLQLRRRGRDRDR